MNRPYKYAAYSLQPATFGSSARLLPIFLILVFFILNACTSAKRTAPTIRPEGQSLACATSQSCFETAVRAMQQGDSAEAMELLKKTADLYPHDRWTAR